MRRLAQPLPTSARANGENEPLAEDLSLHHTVAAQDYADRVKRAQDYIVAGDIFQVVLAQRFTTPFPLPARGAPPARRHL